MKKLLFIAPHLSTGGLPQYLTKKIELLKDEFDIHLVEWVDCTGGVLVVTRNKVTQLVAPEKFYTLDDNKQRLIDIINDIQPDIIHLEEIPEFFMDDNIAQQIYTQDRNYKIVETSHDSSYNTDNKKFYPDKFMFVSQWQINQYKDLDIPKVLVEYPIEYIERPNREEALKELGLDPNKKHILHVGLYTSRKNQAEFFEYAKSLPEYEFHSLGNRADNFKWYWEPLVNEQPSNLTWWNERTDVDKFYQAMDLFLFTSRGHENDKETMPLVIREAISSQIPVLIYNLPVYLNYFHKFSGVSYLEFDNFNNNLEKIKTILNPELKQIDYSKEAFVVCTYPVTDAVIQTTKDCINSLKKYGRKIIISSHAPVPQELQEMVDYVIYDANNFLVKHTFYSNYWCYTDLYDTWVDLRGEGNDRYHGGVCYTSFYNGAILGKNLNHEKLYFVNYDYILKDESYIDHISNILDKKDTYFGFDIAAEGNCYTTYFFAAKASVMLDRLKEIKNEQDYTQCMIDCGSESNGIENMYYHLWKDYPNNYVESKEQFTKNIEKYFHFEDFSMVEYYTILPTNIPNYFCPWIQISNNKESKIIIYTVEKNGIEIINRDLIISGKYQFWDMIKYNLNDEFIVTFKIYDSITNDLVKTHKFELNKNYFENDIKNNGLFTWKGNLNYLNNPKIKIMHLVTDPNNNPKEIRSTKNIVEFCEQMNIKFEQRVNKIWTEIPPADTCARPDVVQDKPGYYKLAPGHYGCYLAHKNAICAEDNTEYDYVIIIEGDTIIDSDYQELYDSLIRFNRLAYQTDMDIIGFGNPWQNRNLNGPKIEDIWTDVTPFIPAQSYLITQSKINRIKHLLENTPWDAIDLWMCNVARLRIGTAEKIYTKHLPGYSIIEQTVKDGKTDNPLIFLEE
jgi:glycosyltransferase involved in cell wall biosynthesis